MSSSRSIPVVIVGLPVPKGRGRAFKTKSGGIAVYTPAKTLNWENTARMEAKLVMRSLKRSMLEGPVKVEIFVYMEIPKSWSPWKREAALKGVIVPACYPDLDNVEKAAMDAMNGIVWKDDSQVVEKYSMKVYREIPAVAITIIPIPLLSPRAKKPDMTENHKRKLV